MFNIFTIYCCIGLISFIFFYNFIKDIVIPNSNNNNEYVVVLFYIFCVLAWPIVVIFFVQDKIDDLNNNSIEK